MYAASSIFKVMIQYSPIPGILNRGLIAIATIGTMQRIQYGAIAQPFLSIIPIPEPSAANPPIVARVNGTKKFASPVYKFNSTGMIL